MSQLAKTVLKLIAEKLKGKVAECVYEEFFKINKGKGTIKAIFILRTKIERCIEKQKHLFMCFINFDMALDTKKNFEIVSSRWQRHQSKVTNVLASESILESGRRN